MLRNALELLIGLAIGFALGGLILLVQWLIALVVGKAVAAYVVTGLLCVVSFFAGRQVYLAVRGRATARTAREFFALGTA